MNDIFEFKPDREEAVFTLAGPGTEQVIEAVFGRGLEPFRLHYLPWRKGAPLAAVCWLPPDRAELRVPTSDGWPGHLAQWLAELSSTRRFGLRLDAVIARVEAWSYADTDPGAGAEEIAAELSTLAAMAPSPRSRREIDLARDALDDGLPGEAVAAALYRARTSGSFAAG